MEIVNDILAIINLAAYAVVKIRWRTMTTSLTTITILFILGTSTNLEGMSLH